MDVLQSLVLVGLGFLGGVLSGLVGVGGATIFVPALVYVAGWGIRDAVAASLVITIFSSLSGTIRNARSEDSPNWRVTALLAATAAPSSLIGVAISWISPQTVVQVVFAVFLLALVYPTLRGQSEHGDNPKRMSLPLFIPAGICFGLMVGLVGIGGTAALVPLIVLGLGLSTKVAISTGLAVTLFTSILAAAAYIATGFGDLLSLPPLIVGSMFGAWFGVRLKELTPEATIRRGFAVFMVVAAVRILVDAMGIL